MDVLHQKGLLPQNSHRVTEPCQAISANVQVHHRETLCTRSAQVYLKETGKITSTKVYPKETRPTTCAPAITDTE